MSRTVVLAKQRKSKTQVKFGPYGFRAGSKYDRISQIAAEKPRELTELVKTCVKRTGISAQRVVYDIRVLCDPRNKSNRDKLHNNGRTKNRFGNTTAKVHLRAVTA